MPLDQIAYLDPGMGSLIWQGLVGGILGAIFFFRNFFAAVWQRISGRSKK